MTKETLRMAIALKLHRVNLVEESMCMCASQRWQLMKESDGGEVLLFLVEVRSTKESEWTLFQYGHFAACN